jgi:sodium/hydrogen antiporter
MLTATMLLAGGVLLAMALAEPAVRRLPVSTSLVYLLAGWAAATVGLQVAVVDPQRHAPLLVVLSEWAVLLSLFAIGLRLRSAMDRRAWQGAALLASATMLITIALATLAARMLLGMDWALALLLAAVLAPTDPVLASDVQTRSANDRDAVRVSLTAEGALNDGTAFPVVMLALGLLGLHDLGPLGAGWWLHDLAWPVAGGIALGWLLGRGIGMALRLHLGRGHSLAWDELLYIGTIALGYGAAAALKLSAFLVVFFAGIGMFAGTTGAASPESASHGLQRRLEAFGERAERLAEVAMVLLLGAALSWVKWELAMLMFAGALAFIVRPLAVLATARGLRLQTAHQTRLVAWFGIRGVGSLFYLAYALRQGVSGAQARDLISATLLCVAVSILLHGMSATPLMRWRVRKNAG